MVLPSPCVEGTSRSSEGWATGDRLRKRAEFLLVQEEGRKIHGPHFLLMALPATRPPGSPTSCRPRFGVTVSKRVGNAVARTRVKRLLREALRRRKGLVPAGMRVVAVARPNALGLHLQEVIAEITRLLARLGPAPPASSAGA